MSLGGPEGPDARLEHPEDGGPRRGPPDRLLRLRGHHPGAPVRRRRRDRLGLGHVGGRGAHARRAQGDRGRRAQVHPQGREAARPVHDRADRRPPGARHGPAVRGRLRAVAAHPQAWARVDRGLGRRGHPGRASRPAARTTRSRPTGRHLDQPGTRRRGRDRPVASAARRGCPATSNRCSRRSPPRPSTTRTGCSRSSGTAIRVQAVVRDGDVRLFTRNLHDAETYFGRLLSPPSWIDAREAIVDGEVVALDEDGAPDFSLLQERISELRSGGRRTSGPLVYQPFDLLYLRRAIAPRGAARVAQAPAQDRPARASPGPLRVARGRQRAGLPCGRPGARPRGDRGQAADLALRAGPPIERVAQDQDPARAGARRRRLDAGRGQRARSRRARDRRRTRTASCASPARSAPASPA